MKIVGSRVWRVIIESTCAVSDNGVPVEREVSHVERAVGLHDGGEHPEHGAVGRDDAVCVHEVLETVVCPVVRVCGERRCGQVGQGLVWCGQGRGWVESEQCGLGRG